MFSKSAAILLLILSGLCHAEITQPKDRDFLSLDLSELLEIKIATGTAKSLAMAPAVATVVTAQDIAAMGATTLDEALAMVPGLLVSHSAQVYSSRYLFRGIASLFNSEALLLLNGIPLTSVFRGDRNVVGWRIPTTAIARIEVIRGPGSAVYGADAYAGVINIITKTREDLDSTQVGALGGSFDSSGAWLTHGGDWGPLKTAITLSWFSTEGPRETITADAQTGFDQLGQQLGLGAPFVSQAPGSPNLQGRYWDLHVDSAFENWRLRLNHEDRHGIGSGQGVAYALDHSSRFGSERSLIDLSYHDPLFNEYWDVETQLSFYHGTQIIERQLLLFPPGAFWGAFPNGFIGNPEFWERSIRFEQSGVYTGWQRHRLRLGVGYHRGEAYRIRETKNFDATFAPLPGGVTDVTDTAAVYLPETGRSNRHLLVQDEWQLSEAWELTAGVRHDRYSDFGNTTNPRLALVWASSFNLTTKLLYGRAFRVPSFVDLYTANNPVTIGNPHLKPETISTTELAFSYQASPQLHMDFNLFHYNARDFINFIKDPGTPTLTAQNASKFKGEGFELQAVYKPSWAYQLLANYSYQQARDVDTNQPRGDVPNSMAYVRSDWQILPTWHCNLQANWLGERKRAAGDPRLPLKGYTTVDLIMRGVNLAERLDVTLTLRNLFDADVREPSQAPSALDPFVPLPNDLPQAGRSVMAGLSYRL